MNDAGWRRPDRRRQVAGLVAALAMQALWLGLLNFGQAPTPHERRVAVVRLLPEPRQAMARPPPARMARTERPRRADTEPTEAPAAAGAAMDPRGDTRPDPAAAPVAVPVAEVRSALNLALPRGRPASAPALARQVKEDPRSHSERRTLEWAIADGAGTLAVDVQTSTSGSGGRVIRQGGKCTRAYDSRIAALHPMDETLKGMPSSVGDCFKP